MPVTAQSDESVTNTAPPRLFFIAAGVAALLFAGWTTCILITALDCYGLPELFEKTWKVIAGR